MTFFRIFIFVLFAFTIVVKADCQKTPQLKTIIIDAGHGKPDIGARGSFSTESEVTLMYAQILGKKIQQHFPDVKVIYTRTTPFLPNNLENSADANRLRAEIANQNKGDLYIAIHADSEAQKYKKILTGTRERKKTVKDKKGKKTQKTIRENVYKRIPLPHKAKGSSMYIIAAHKSKDKDDIIKENLDMLVDDSEESKQEFNSPEIVAMASVWQKKFFKKSLLFASLMHEELKRTKRLSLGVKQRNKGIWVLQATSMPSVLFETGYICTNSEEIFLNSEEGQNQLTDAVIKALKNYKQLIEANTYIIPKEMLAPELSQEELMAQEMEARRDSLDNAKEIAPEEREEKIFQTFKIAGQKIKIELINNNVDDESTYSLAETSIFVNKKKISNQKPTTFYLELSNGDEIGLTLIANDLVDLKIGSIKLKIYDGDNVREVDLLVSKNENAAIILKKQVNK